MSDDRAALLGALEAGGVRFILIGGAAIETHGLTHVTFDVDIVPDEAQENLERLASVLNELKCELVIDPAQPGIPLPGDYFTARSLTRQTMLNLRTAHGELDLMFTPAGFPRGFADLESGARRLIVAGTDISVLVANLDDIERSKRAAGREKDADYFARREAGSDSGY